MPTLQVAAWSEAADDASDTLPRMGDRDPLAVAHPSVINSTDIYRRLPLPLAVRRLDLRSCRSADDLLSRLTLGASFVEQLAAS